MALNTQGNLLEGIRISEGNNPFTFPPRSLVTNQAALDAVTARAEYVLVTTGPDSQDSFEIADAGLSFQWTRNDPGAARFSYDSFSNRWLPSPGGAPDEVGPLGNEPRLAYAVPDLSLTEAPYALYVGSPVRAVTFFVVLVGSSGDFTPPASLPAGTVEISSQDGSLNFSQSDVDSYGGQTVLGTRQSFFDRAEASGRFGVLPNSADVDYFLFLNPRPFTGQVPLVRIGYGRYLTAIEVPDEASLGSPAVGTFHWSTDTARVRFSGPDVLMSFGDAVYYDGVVMGSTAPVRIPVVPAGAWPSAAFTIPGAVGLTDEQRFVIFAELSDRSYWEVRLFSGVPGSAPAPGIAFIDVSNGNVFLSAFDVAAFSSWDFFWLDSILSVEDGVSVQFYRSGANGSGTAQAPDFVRTYEVTDQIIVDGLRPSPFIMLPTVPLEDGLLEYRIDQGPASSGTFSGNLVDATDPILPGFGYLLNLDDHQLSFTFRKTTTLTLGSPTPAVKLEDAAIVDRGFEVQRDGEELEPDVDFDFDADTGLLTFLTPVGQNDLNDVSGVVGTVSLPLTFAGPAGTFSESSVGKYLLVQGGANVGVYQITDFVSSSIVNVDVPFAAAGPTTADIRSQAEILADRFWLEIFPPFKKFTLSRSGTDGVLLAIPNTEFEVFANTGQVNLNDPAQPGEQFQVQYTALLSDDGGATVEEVSRTEFGLFKVRLETGTFADGSRVVSFNPDARPLSLERPVTVYVDGVPLGPEFFEVEAPSTLRVTDPLAAGQLVTIDYWVEDATGGETNFNLLLSPVDLDTPSFSAGDGSMTFNGDQTPILSMGSVLFVGRREVLIVASATYDGTSDVTTVVFTAPAVADSDGGEILGCAPVTDFVTETGVVSNFVGDTNAFFIDGDVSTSYPAGTILLFGEDPYYVEGAEFQANIGRTKVSTSSPASQSYIIPALQRSVRPVFFPGVRFFTKLPASLASPFTLVNGGENRKVLEQGADYTVAEGGIVELTEDAEFGDVLYAFYLGQVVQAAGTVFELNYAYAVAPDGVNGMLGQRLVSTYNLYAPDTFFYRVETVVSFIPEVQDLLREQSQSAGSSGPNTADATGLTNKDFGKPSPWYDEQHQANLDLVISRLLKLYNDIINIYEDILADMDGRVVGGSSGRFRFDGNTDNPPRDSYSEITNDIDDRIKLYDQLQLTGFFTFALVPVYGTMAFPNPLSRIFPTQGTKPAALNDQTSPAEFGLPIGSLEAENILSVTSVKSSRANQFFTDIDVTGTILTIPQNGDEALLVPEFVGGQDVDIYTEDGVLHLSTTVVTAGPVNVELADPAALTRGSVLQDVSDSGNSLNHYYVAGRDLAVNPENGQITNINTGSLFQNAASGNEIIDFSYTFGNQGAAPRLFPALEGLELDDDGTVPAPRLRYQNETTLLEDEETAMAALGVGGLPTSLDLIEDSSLTVGIGTVVQFVNGPNAGVPVTVTSVVSATSFNISPSLSTLDPGIYDMLIASPADLIQVLLRELNVVGNNLSAPPVPPSLLGTLNSEILSCELAVQCWGDLVASGTGDVTANNVLEDPSADFILAGVIQGSIVWVPSGANRGIYRVTVVASDSLTVDLVDPWTPFPSFSSTGYQVFKPESFLAPRQFGIISQVYREALTFYTQTQAWLFSISQAGVAARQAEISARRAQLTASTSALSSSLSNDRLYVVRYLWIDQRTNKKTGTLARQVQAEERREETLDNIVKDQQKLLILNSL